MKSENIVENRAWGHFEVIEESRIGPSEFYQKIKRLYVYPGKNISFQYHNSRAEVWIIEQGEGLLALDDQIRSLSKGQTIVIGPKQKHSVKSTGSNPLQILEIQIGSEVEESDIVRLSLDFPIK